MTPGAHQPSNDLVPIQEMKRRDVFSGRRCSAGDHDSVSLCRRGEYYRRKAGTRNRSRDPTAAAGLDQADAGMREW